MQSVKKVLTRRLPRYNLRSHRSKVSIVKSSTPKVDRNIQVDLSEEEREADFAELPFRSQETQETDDEIYASSRSTPREVQPRSSTAFSRPDQADITDRALLDISLDQNIVQVVPPSFTDSEGPHTISPSISPVLPPLESQHTSHSSPAHIGLEIEDITDSDDDSLKELSDQRNRLEQQQRPLLINSPADLYTLVPRVNKHTGTECDPQYTIEETNRRSSEEDEVESSSSASEHNVVETSSESRDEIEEEGWSLEDSETSAMEADLFKGLQEQMAAIQAQLAQQQVQQKQFQAQQQKTTSVLERAPLPESASTHRPSTFHGFDSEDISRWLDKLESYLRLRRIDPTSPTALAEVELNLAGPAEDFFYSLPAERKATFGDLRNALKERFSNDNQSWITWQAVSTRQQGTLEPLDTYLTELTSKFRRLKITDAEKMRYFVQGLRSEIRKAVLLKQPKSFREAEEMARLACSVENTMINSPENSVATQLNNLSQTVRSLASAGVNTTTPNSLAENKLLAVIEQNNAQMNAALANISASIQGAPGAPRVQFASPPTSTVIGQSSVAALTSPYSGNQGNIEIQQLEDRLFKHIETLDRQYDARIRGLARRNQDSREQDQPRQRTRDGRPVCFHCNRTGHFLASCPDRRNAGPRSQLPPQYRPQGNNHTPSSGYNQPRREDNNTNNYINPSYRRENYQEGPPRQDRTDPHLAILDEGWYDDEFCGTLQPSNGKETCLCRRSQPKHNGNNAAPTTMPNYTQKIKPRPANLHERIIEQHVLASLSNQQQPETGDSTHEVELSGNQVTHETMRDQSCDIPSVPEEIKPIVDLVLRVIKHQTAGTPTKESGLKDLSFQTSSAKGLVCESNQVKPKQNRRSADPETAAITTSDTKRIHQSAPHARAHLQSSDLTTTAQIAGQEVQILVDTGGCFCAMDEQFFKKTYGQSPPKMTDGVFPSVQTVSGERVPVLGKISVPIHLNGSKYSCDFHVMQNLTYKAILGRDFLQQNQALIDLENHSITFKGSAEVRKKRKSATCSPVMGTFIRQTQTSKGTRAVTEMDSEPLSLMSNHKTIQRSQKKNKMVFSQFLLPGICIVLCLLTASPTFMPESSKPMVQEIINRQDTNVKSGNIRVSIPVSQTNHKEPYKVYRNDDGSQRLRVSSLNTKKAVEVQKNSINAVTESSVDMIREKNAFQELTRESPLSDVPDSVSKEDFEIKQAPSVNKTHNEL